MKIGIWDVGDGSPQRLEESTVGYEKDLEEWIAADPSLLQYGLTIVGRQFHTEGGPIDLLAIDPQGRWVVIEIKRGYLVREVIAQVIDYASSLSVMPEDELREKADLYLSQHGQSVDALLKERSSEESIERESRDILLMVVGTGKVPGLDRMAEYLSTTYELPISVITFNVFKSDLGNDVLARELYEPEASPRGSTAPTRHMHTVDEISTRADEAGVGKEFRTILQAGLEVGLNARPYKRSIMYTPPSRRDRMIFTVWAEKKDDGVSIYVGLEPFVEFYPLSEADVVRHLGFEESGWYALNAEEARAFADGLRTLFAGIKSDQDEGA